MDRFAEMDALLQQALQKVGDPRRVWLQSSTGFESRMELHRGMILGGALSPHYLSKPSGDAMHHRIPFTVWMESVQILVCPAPRPAFADWIPFLEALSKRSEGLILLTPRIDGEELFGALLVNYLKGVLRFVAVSPPPGEAADLKALSRKLEGLDLRSKTEPASQGYLAGDAVPAPQILDLLPRVKRVAIRRGCSVVIPHPGVEKNPNGVEIAVLRVGGENIEDLHERIVYLDDQLRLLELKR